MSLSWLETECMRTVFVRFFSELEALLVELSDIYTHIREETLENLAGEHQVSAVSPLPMSVGRLGYYSQKQNGIRYPRVINVVR